MKCKIIFVNGVRLKQGRVLKTELKNEVETMRTRSPEHIERPSRLKDTTKK